VGFKASRFDFFSLDVMATPLEELRAHVTPETLKDLKRMREVSRCTSTGIVDFQYGIRHGRTYIADPLNVIYAHGFLGLVIQGITLATLDQHIKRVGAALDISATPSRR